MENFFLLLVTAIKWIHSMIYNILMNKYCQRLTSFKCIMFKFLRFHTTHKLRNRIEFGSISEKKDIIQISLKYYVEVAGRCRSLQNIIQTYHTGISLNGHHGENQQLFIRRCLLRANWIYSRSKIPEQI